MRRRTLGAVGVGAGAGVAAWALLATSLAGPLGTPAAATELTSFAGCDELRRWYVDAALPHVGPWGLGGPLAYAEDALAIAGSASESREATPEAAVGNGETGTNVQEAGVDEPDSAKTDGDTVFHLARGHVVVTDVTGEPRRLSRIDLPQDLGQPELLLVGDRLLVLGRTADVWIQGGMARDMVMPAPGNRRTTTRVLVVDVADPSSPRVQHDTRYSGTLLSAREYDGVVRLVVSTATPDLEFVHPDERRSPAQATAENRRIVRESTVEDWLPTVGPGGSDGSGFRPLVECTDVRHPDRASGFSTISVVTFAALTPAERETTAVTASGDLVYSSASRLYVATSTEGWWWSAQPVPLVDSRDQREPDAPTTMVHAFALDGLGTDYVASGEVPGRVRDRWSFSEHDGYLRVATALGKDPWNPRENGVVVLQERGDTLTEVGRVAKMGIRERIQSVRWFGDVAVVVTFRQVDPLYTLDLSDPTSPRVLGELKIPGFSSYLHPVGDELLLGLGQDATMDGQSVGAQAATFDIRDLSAPTRVDTEAFRRHSEFLAAWDPRAFTYLPEQRTALAPVQSSWTGKAQVAVLRIGEDGTIRRTTLPVPGPTYPGAVRALPLRDGEIALVAGATVTKTVV